MLASIAKFKQKFVQMLAQVFPTCLQSILNLKKAVGTTCARLIHKQKHPDLVNAWHRLFFLIHYLFLNSSIHRKKHLRQQRFKAARPNL
jgi:hypothetical protein